MSLNDLQYTGLRLQEFLGLNQLKILKKIHKGMSNVINPPGQVKDGRHVSTESGSQMNTGDVVARPIYLTSARLGARAAEQNQGVSFGQDEGTKWLENTHRERRKKGRRKKKDLLASNPHHT